MIADSDIESEKFRFLGESRFTLAGLKCMILNKVYPGTLHYLPVREYQLQVIEGPEESESLSDLTLDVSIKKKPMLGSLAVQM